MKWIGLTGGIACGKSEVTSRLKAKGWSVVDADALAHMALRPGQSSYQQIIQHFGPLILNLDKTIDRQKLAQVVFNNKDELAFLESVVHPWVQAKVREQRDIWEQAKHTMAFYDVPLLFEKNLQDQFDAVVVVACDESTQIARLKKRNGFSEEQARQRIAAQLPLEEKIKKANFVIENNGDLLTLDKNIDVVLTKL
ncbi:MAG: dephospho-CoA kinase [Bdellovibrionaceae bacterium]|nr:dephospho-CoA kinase [Pseudobdellovibrionaceae bacterium]